MQKSYNKSTNYLIKLGNTGQGFIQDFQFGGGDVVCGLTGMGEYFSQVTFPRSRQKWC